MHKYRSHTLGELRKSDVGTTVKLSGWVHRKRDHGNIMFLDLRDNYGLTQLVFNNTKSFFEEAVQTKYESVITITGTVVARSSETVNTNLNTGEIEVMVEEFLVESKAHDLPFSIAVDQDLPEDLRLKYRFLDLRRDKIHSNILLRSQVIREIREQMHKIGFIEFQTPILTASSPEGARDFLVPSRMHPGKFYALPQAPQQFKQLLMVSGFDRYFQIAPCFRDEDSRADRSPGEFYQLDLEMSYVTQEDVFTTMEPVLHHIFTKFSTKQVTNYPFPRITYETAMLKYGVDKPDLRNPLIISDVTEIFKDSDFSIFANNIKQGSVVRAIPATNVSGRPRSFFDNLNSFAQTLGAPGLGYIVWTETGEAKGPIAKFLPAGKLAELQKLAGINNGDALFFVCNKELDAAKLAGKIRTELGNQLDLLEKNVFKFCWIVDFPYFEWNDDKKAIDFNHNPFSMPQGGLEALENAKTTEDLLKIKAFQYDIVCNGVELSSGAIRNHTPEIMYKAFNIVGYSHEDVDAQFGGMIKAFKYGAPPHGGFAPGIDRMVMLIADEPNIREIIAFPLNQQAEDLLMQAPNIVTDKQLKELDIQLTPQALKNIKKETAGN
ncbi:aspartate--tRNA ligase [Rickettsiales endosymbiont of Stachyamoeba lipophora]|uniref:aspartate--tRNA ligase n=1 Tax=Rickettsiales endosymbiont of Stachyamoeba lipophora TaxID=2486578 RepID=UPI000F64C4E3|nr:aspartate--tRNA ligase [Rickettsiales endosymbiont of Stachyamoeba lipophora]AZL15597.1 aspartate--tRNA ligase [Rickettsiales endosymbiont of Stachyamoeba lipophora]